MSERSERAVAIVGLGAILPDAPCARAFRDNVWAEKYSITEVPPDRWSVADYYDPDPAAPAKTYSKIGAWVRGFTFDWKRWVIPPRVAGAMDEGQQWAITIAAEALADYGYPQRKLDVERTAVVLADKAIASKLPQATWDGVRDLLTKGLSLGKGAQGFTDAIAECGKILSKEFPIQANDTNELPNQLRVLN